MSIFRKKEYLLFLFAVELAVFALLIAAYFPFTPDDGFIYLYGARELAGGRIPNYTPGETPTNAFGSPLWLLMLAPSFVLSVPPLIWAKIAGLALLVATAFIMGKLLLCMVRGLEKPAAFALSFSILCLPFMVACAVNALDTLLAAFLLVLSLYFAVQTIDTGRGCAKTGCAIGLMLVSRPDAFLSAAILLIAVAAGVARRNEGRGRSAVSLAAGLLPGLLLLTAAMAVFHEALPNSAAAKTPGIGKLFSVGLYRDALFSFARDFSTDPVLAVIYLALIPFCLSIRNAAFRVLYPALALVHLAVFLLARDWMGLHRLYLPSIAAALAAFFFVVASVFESKERILAAATLLVLIMPMGHSHWKTHMGYNYAHPGSPAEMMGRFIAANKLPDSYVMTSDMGVVPYFAGAPAIDSNDAPICNAWRRKHPDDLEYIFKRNVDFIIMINARSDGKGMPVFSINEKIYASGAFQDRYTRVGMATWRPAIEDYKERGLPIGYGRYFHLYVSKRIRDRLSDNQFRVF
ncbi:MAG: hypothetical protein HY770_04020 [Chitinivibrionia bacterium]|nr:hypothetical protein [Chitinivibrionia bacterium]